MPALRLEMYKKVISPLYKMTHPDQYKMYEEVLSFEGGYAFASEDELTVRKTDGTTFRTSLRHYESDFLTETYVGRLSNGEQFRFIFASENNPLAQMDPMVTFGSMSTSGWAVHYRVKKNMGFFDLFRKTSSSSSEKSIRKNYVGNMIHLTFPTPKGDFTVKANSVSGHGGAKGVVMYDCFIVALGQWQQQGMGEDDFIHDMEKVVNLVADGNNNKTVMETLLKQHIAQFGRLIDTDLCTYISELYLALIAVNGSCNRNELLEQMMQVAERGFGNKLFITQYRRSAYGIQPYLVSFADFSRNR